MDMPVSNHYCFACSSYKFMEMVLIEISIKSDIVNMVSATIRNGLSRHSCKTMIMRILLWFCYFNTTLDFMHMGLLPNFIITLAIFSHNR